MYYENKMAEFENSASKTGNSQIGQVREELRALERKTNELLGNMEDNLRDLQSSIENDKDRNHKMKTAKNHEI